MVFFFFSSRRRHTRFDCDWSSDVCSSDLHLLFLHWEVPAAELQSLLPLRLSVDTFEGKAYVGLVPFTLSGVRSEEHTSELQSQSNLVCRLLLEKKKTNRNSYARVWAPTAA